MKPPRWWRLAAVVQPQVLALVLFGLLLLGLRLAYRQPLLKMIYPSPITQHQISVKYALCLMGCFALASLLRHPRQLLSRDRTARRLALRRSLGMIRDWMPFIFCVWVYENLHDLTYLIRPDTMDHWLSRADVWLFGVQPTLWLQRWTLPLVTDYLDLAYMTYFVFPPLLAGWLYFRGHVYAFKELQLTLLIAFYAGFLGYITVPAVGPQHILAADYAVPLRGLFLHWHIDQAIHKLQSFPRDCFPSMHTAISSVTLYFCWRHRRLLPWRGVVLGLVFTLTASLWFSTVYLRYHWFVDVVAGWALTILATAAGVTLQRIWPSREKNHPQPPPRRRSIDTIPRPDDH